VQDRNGLLEVTDVAATLPVTIVTSQSGEFTTDKCSEPGGAVEKVSLRQVVERVDPSRGLGRPINAEHRIAGEGLAVDSPLEGEGGRFPQDSYVAVMPNIAVCWPPGSNARPWKACIAPTSWQGY